MPAAIRRYLALLAKEVQQLRRNRVLLIQLMLPPTIVLVIFGFALNPKVRDLRLGVVDESFTTESRDFDRLPDREREFQCDVTVYTERRQAEDALKSLDLDLFIVIPSDFSITLGRGQTADVQVVIDAVDANTAQIAQGYLRNGSGRVQQRASARLPLVGIRAPAYAGRASHILLRRRGLLTYSQPISTIPGW